MEYKCYKCFYITDRKSNLINHLNRKRKCIRNNNCYYKDEEIETLNNNQIIKDNENIYMCNFCKKEFSKKYCMDRHIKQSHVIIETGVTNINNINNTLNNNTLNVTVNINKPLAFNEDWDLSKINNSEKHLLLFSNIMYTKLLEKILENEINLNVILDKNSNSGIVYTNNNNNKEYINMDFENIIKASMEKINKHLNNIYDDIDKNIIGNDYIENCKKTIDEKYEKFVNNKNTQTIVETFLTDIYSKTNDKALQIMKDINSNEIQGY